MIFNNLKNKIISIYSFVLGACKFIYRIYTILPPYHLPIKSKSYDPTTNKLVHTSKRLIQFAYNGYKLIAFYTELNLPFFVFWMCEDYPKNIPAILFVLSPSWEVATHVYCCNSCVTTMDTARNLFNRVTIEEFKVSCMSALKKSNSTHLLCKGLSQYFGNMDKHHRMYFNAFQGCHDTEDFLKITSTLETFNYNSPNKNPCAGSYAMYAILRLIHDIEENPGPTYLTLFNGELRKLYSTGKRRFKEEILLYISCYNMAHTISFYSLSAKDQEAILLALDVAKCKISTQIKVIPYNEFWHHKMLIEEKCTQRPFSHRKAVLFYIAKNSYNRVMRDLKYYFLPKVYKRCVVEVACIAYRKQQLQYQMFGIDINHKHSLTIPPELLTMIQNLGTTFDLRVYLGRPDLTEDDIKNAALALTLLLGATYIVTEQTVYRNLMFAIGATYSLHKLYKSMIPQSGELEAIFNIMLQGYSLGVFNSSVNTDSVNGYFQSLLVIKKNVGVTTTWLNDVKSWIINLTTFLAGLFGREINGLMGLHYNVLKNLSDEIVILTEAWSVHNNLPVDLAPRVIDISRRLDELHANVVEESSKGVNMSAVIARINRLVVNLKPLHDAAVRMGLSSSNRVEPFLFNFLGHPGTGKSFIQIHVAKTLYLRQCSVRQMSNVRDKPDATVFVKPFGSKFWSGYSSHPIVVYNDAFQATDAAGQESEATDIIQCVGDNPVPLNMNLNDEKGKVFFCADILAINTNVEYFFKSLFASINEPIAMVRRFKHSYYVGIKPAYGKMGSTPARLGDSRYYLELDASKIPPGDVINTDPYCFRRWDMAKEAPVGPWMNYDQLIAELGVKYDEHVAVKRDNRLRKMQSNAELIINTAVARGFELPDAINPAINADPWEHISIDLRTGAIAKPVVVAPSYYERFMMLFQNQSSNETYMGIYVLNEYYAMLEIGEETSKRGLVDYALSIPKYMKIPYTTLVFLASLSRDDGMAVIEAGFSDGDIKTTVLKERYGKEGLFTTITDLIVENCLQIKAYLHQGLLWFIDHPIVCALIATGFSCGVLYAITQMVKNLYSGPSIDHQINAVDIEESSATRFISLRSRNNQVRVFTESVVIVDGVSRSICVGRINGLWLGANYLLVNYHYYEDCLERLKKGPVSIGFLAFDAWSKTPSKMYAFSTIKWLTSDTMTSLDLIVIQVPTGHMAPNFIKYLPSTKHKTFMTLIDEVNPRSALFVTYKTDAIYKLHLGIKIGGSVPSPVAGRTYPNTLVASVSDVHGMAASTINGDCGGVGYLTDSILADCTKDGAIYQNPVPFYFHIGVVPSITSRGGKIFETNHTYGVPLFREYFEHLDIPGIDSPEDALSHKFRLVHQAFAPLAIRSVDPPTPFLHQSALFEQHHKVVATMPQMYPVTMINEINKSPLHGIFTEIGYKPTRVPAKLYSHILASGEFCDPMIMARKDYGSNETNNTCFQVVERAGSYTSRRIIKASSIPRPRLLTFEEAVMGVPSLNLSSINRSTSSGFVGNLIKKICSVTFKGKEGFFGNNDLPDCNLPMAQCLKKLVLEEEQELLDGKSIMHIWADCLKSELLAREKVALGKARLFCAGEIDFLILTIMYYGAFVAWILENRIKNGIAVGINPTSPEWLLMYNYLRSIGNNGIFGDYSKYDKRLAEIFMMSAKFIIKAFYKDLYCVVHDRLFEQLVISVHVVHHQGLAYFYIWNHGNTSGNYLTAILNSIVNEIIVFYCIFMIYLKEGKTLDQIEDITDKNVRLVVYGDDNAISVSDKIRDDINFLSLQREICDIGLEYTDELKSGSVELYKPICEGNFIARSFRFELIGGVTCLLAPLRLASTLEAVQWDKRGESHLTRHQTIDLTFKEMRRHGEDFFKQFAPILDYNSVIKIGYKSKYADWIVVRDTYWETYSPKFDGEFTGEVLDCTPWSPNESTVVGLDSLPLLSSSSSTINNNNLDSSNLAGALSRMEGNHSTLKFQMDADTRQFGGCSVNEVKQSTTAVETYNTTVFDEGRDIKESCLVERVVETEIERTDDSIATFLEKPYRYTSVNWTTARAAGYELTAFSLGQLLTSVAPWNNKIIGYNLMRGKFRVRVTVNASPMQAGALIVHYVPLLKDTTTTAQTTVHCNPYSVAGAVTLVTATQHPNIVLDVDNDTSGELIIPFIAPTSFYNMKDQDYDWGVLFINVLSPLTCGASAPNTNVEMTIYVSVSDLELSAPLCPQMEKGDYISSSMKKVGKVPYPKGIPGISETLSTISWVSTYLGGLASAFGWSKPQLDAQQEIMVRSHFQYANCSEGAVPAKPTTLNADPKVSVIKHSITDEDEMSTKFLFSVPWLGLPITWNASDSAGAALYANTGVRPAYFYQTYTGTFAAHTYTVNCGNPMYNMSQVLSYYRGSIYLKLKIIKTKFHTGRLLIIFTPGRNNSTAPTRDTSIYSLREIVDLRDKSEVIFNLPYMQELDYLSQSQNLGYLTIIVQNELRAPETVAQSIKILPYFWAGEDFEMSGVGISSGSIYNLPFVPQMNNEDIITIQGIGGRRINPDTVAPAARSMSEKLTSVKQLINRYTQLNLKSFPAGYNAFAFFPWAISLGCINVGTGALTAGEFVNDIYSFIAPMYAMYRGGMRVALTQQSAVPICGAVSNGVFSQNGTSSSFLVSASTLKGTSTAPVYNTTADISFSTAPCDYNTSISDIIVPYQSATRASPVLSSSTYYGAALDGYHTTTWTGISKPGACANFSSSAVTTATAMLYRGTADDFQFMFFVNAPPLLVSYV